MYFYKVIGWVSNFESSLWKNYVHLVFKTTPIKNLPIDKNLSTEQTESINI